MQIPIYSRKRLGRALHDARRQRGLTQHQLAAMSGIAQPTISNIERAVTGTSLDTLLRLLGYLDLELVLQPRPELDAKALWDAGG